MWNEPTPEELARLSQLYEAGQPDWRQITIYEHFFLGGCDWYMAEYSPHRHTCFGYAILNDDLNNAEWGVYEP